MMRAIRRSAYALCSVVVHVHALQVHASRYKPPCSITEYKQRRGALAWVCSCTHQQMGGERAVRGFCEEIRAILGCVLHCVSSHHAPSHTHRLMLSHLDRKLRKTMSMLSEYQTEVARCVLWPPHTLIARHHTMHTPPPRLVRNVPPKAHTTLRNAMLKNLNTQSVLLSIIDFRQRALFEDVLTQLYDTLLELCTCNLVDVAALLGCPVSSPYVTYRVMQLVNGTVESRKTWLMMEFDNRKDWVVHTIAELNATYDVLVPVPLRRSASMCLQRSGGMLHTSPLKGPPSPENSPSTATAPSPLPLRASYEYSMGHYRSRAKTSDNVRRDMMGGDDDGFRMPRTTMTNGCAASCSRTVVEMFRKLDEAEGCTAQPTMHE